MKHYRLIGFAVASILSLGGFAMLTSAEEVKINRDFKIQNIIGDSAVLSGVGLESIIKTGQNSFEKVTVSNDDATFKPTKFDTYRFVGEEVLENKEVYRNMQRPAVLETDQYLLAASLTSGFPYATDVPLVRLNIKDVKTGEVSKFEPTLDVTSSEYIYNEALHVYEGTYYYAALAEGMRGTKSRILIYTINPKTGEFKKYHELEGSNMWDFKLLSGKLVTKQYIDNEGDKLLVLDLGSKTLKEVNVSEQEEIESLGSLYESNGRLYVESNYKMYPFDLETFKFSSGVGSELTDLADNEWYFLEDILVKDNKMYQLYNINGEGVTPYQLLQVSDLLTTDVVYVGKIIQRADQGLVEAYSLVEMK